MSGTGGFKGISAAQDGRYSEYVARTKRWCIARWWLHTLPHLSKTKKLLKTMKFPKEYEQHVDIKKVNLEVMRGWVAKRVTALLGVEDEVVIAYVIEQLELPPAEARVQCAPCFST